GDANAISQLMGERHKVRNFYGNILDPYSERGEVTIDTHAVAAALMRPLAQSDAEVLHNFKTSQQTGKKPENWVGAKGSALTGVHGTYGIYADAYREAAAELGILPRELQSITWEGVRGLFPDVFKTAANKKVIEQVWRNPELSNTQKMEKI